MTYVENRDTREILIRYVYLCEEAYKRYHDTDFKKQYQALWNAHLAGVPFNVGATYQDDDQFVSAEFLFNVGVFYQDDDQFDVAVEYHERAAAQGHEGAQYSLAMLNEDHHEQLLRYLGQAAAQDHPEALYDLGSLYFSSDAVPQDWNRAQEYFKRAATEGHIEAQDALEKSWA
jgi:TPR repeat protein